MSGVFLPWISYWLIQESGSCGMQNNRFSPQIQDLAPPPVLEVLDPTLPVPVR